MSLKKVRMDVAAVKKVSATLFKPQVQLSLWSAARVCICPCAVCVCEMCVSKCLGVCLWEWIPALWLQDSSSLWSGELCAPITSTHRTGEKSHIHQRHTAAHQAHAYPLFSTLLWLHWTFYSPLSSVALSLSIQYS